MIHLKVERGDVVQRRFGCEPGGAWNVRQLHRSGLDPWLKDGQVNGCWMQPWVWPLLTPQIEVRCNRIIAPRADVTALDVSSPVKRTVR